MPQLSPDAEAVEARRRRNFGRFVVKAMADASERGMTLADMEAATGLGDSTFSRWKKGQWTKDPRPGAVHAFCEGLGASRAEAYAALGWAPDGGREISEPEPPLDPRLRAIARRLSDPNVSMLEKIAIQAQLDYILKGKLPQQD